MKKALLNLSLLLAFVITATSLNAQDCPAFAGEYEAPPVTQYCPEVNQLSDLIPGVISPPSDLIDHSIVVTTDSFANVTTWDENIEVIFVDGVIDFSILNPGTYCFTSISYRQTELDLITNHPTVQALLATGCMMGGEDLQGIVECIKENFPLSTIGGAVDSILTQIIPLVMDTFMLPNPPPCFDLTPDGEEWCVTILSPGEGCIVDIEDFYNETAIPTSNVPNPFSDKTIVKFFVETSEKLDFKVFDLLGNLIHESAVISYPGNNEIDFDGSNLSDGVYFYTLGNNEVATPNRMVVSR